MRAEVLGVVAIVMGVVILAFYLYVRRRGTTGRGGWIEIGRRVTQGNPEDGSTTEQAERVPSTCTTAQRLSEVLVPAAGTAETGEAGSRFEAGAHSEQRREASSDAIDDRAAVVTESGEPPLPADGIQEGIATAEAVERTGGSDGRAFTGKPEAVLEKETSAHSVVPSELGVESGRGTAGDESDDSVRSGDQPVLGDSGSVDTHPRQGQIDSSIAAEPQASPASTQSESGVTSLPQRFMDRPAAPESPITSTELPATDKSADDDERGTDSAKSPSVHPGEEFVSAASRSGDTQVPTAAERESLEPRDTASTTSSIPDELPTIERRGLSIPSRRDVAQDGSTEGRVPSANSVTDTVRSPGRYRGLDRSRPRPRTTRATPAPEIPFDRPVEPSSRTQPLPLELRIQFDRTGFCNIALLPRRASSSPECLTIVGPTRDHELVALQDEWYADVTPDELPGILEEGVRWIDQDEARGYVWTLTGRDVFVLSARNDISGFITRPCLELGREHVVLCRASIRSEVASAITAVGGDTNDEIGESLGVPQGWTMFRHVTPERAVESPPSADILNALRPLPNVRIEFEGGIRLKRTEWLEGYPPKIRVYGLGAAAAVQIDGEAALCDAEGTYNTPSSSSLGKHSVWCQGKSRSYTIAPFVASWSPWKAFTVPVSAKPQSTLSICGPLVRVDAKAESGIFPLSVPETNTVIVGANPGEFSIARRASSLRGLPCIASTSFRAVWALPDNPLGCDKQRIRVLFVGGESDHDVGPLSSHAPRTTQEHAPRTTQEAIKWSRAILDSGRKGLTLEPESEEIRRLWRTYKRLARTIWRLQR